MALCRLKGGGGVAKRDGIEQWLSGYLYRAERSSHKMLICLHMVDCL